MVLPVPVPPTTRMLCRSRTARWMAAHCFGVMIPAVTYASSEKTEEALRRMVNTGPGETFGGMTASKRAPHSGGGQRQLALKDRVFAGDGTADRARDRADQGFGVGRRHRADRRHVAAQPVDPEPAIRIEHDLPRHPGSASGRTAPGPS